MKVTLASVQYDTFDIDFQKLFDFMKNEKAIIKGLKTFVDIVKPNQTDCYVYVLTNFNTTFEDDWYRVTKIREVGLDPDIRIYRKSTAPKILRD